MPSAPSGKVELDGPVYLGIDAFGSSSIEGAAKADCETESCTQVSFAVRAGSIRMRELKIAMPPSLEYTEAGGTLRLDGVRFRNEHPAEVPLGAPIELDGVTTRSFTFPERSIQVIASGRIHGVPVTVQLANSGKIEGTLVEGRRRTVELGSMDFAFVDALGQTWALSASISGWVSHRRFTAGGLRDPPHR